MNLIDQMTGNGIVSKVIETEGNYEVVLTIGDVWQHIGVDVFDNKNDAILKSTQVFCEASEEFA